MACRRGRMYSCDRPDLHRIVYDRRFQRRHTHRKVVSTMMEGKPSTADTMAARTPGRIWTGSRADYHRASILPELITGKVFHDDVVAHWSEDGNCFWYQRQLRDGSRQFLIVDALSGVSRPAFDHVKITEAVGSLTEIVEIQLTDDVNTLILCLAENWLQYDVLSNTTQPAAKRSKIGSCNTSIKFVNNTKRYVQIIWVDQLSKDRHYCSLAAGNLHNQRTFAGHLWKIVQMGTVIGFHEAKVCEETVTIFSDNLVSVPTVWHKSSIGGKRITINQQSSSKSDSLVSPDAAYAASLTLMSVKERTITLTNSAPPDGIYAKYEVICYKKPGDPLATQIPVLTNVASEKIVPILADLFPNPFALSDLRWHASSKFFTFLYNERGHQRYRMIAVDISGAARVLIDEESATFINYRKQYVHYLDDTSEIIWSSERDGWRHLYLYDMETGALKHQITKGHWVVRDVDQVIGRNLVLRVGGFYPDMDPYLIHYIRVDVDSCTVTRLTAANGTHRLSFSPGRRYYIDRYSRIDVPPVIDLHRSSDGQLISRVDSADASALYEVGWNPPIPFSTLGRDGTTTIYGMISLPPKVADAKSAPSCSFPVIERIYAGPQDSSVPKEWSPSATLDTLELASLGFAVVEIDGMGTCNRSKAFHDVCWHNIADAGFPDRILWIRAAAEKFNLNLGTGVGIFGVSAGGQNAMGALIFHHEFYKAAAADCGCHDNRIDKLWWSEQWMGWPVGKHYAQQSNVVNAHRMQGKLLLTVGERDSNVDPASTMQVVRALIDADKDFELIVFPGGDHCAGENSAYGVRRRNDFFVRSLLGVEPRSS